ncbi:MAG: DUF5107 domain-containing protein [Actinomyces urogenitalis]|uniref:DUF5107 domain-containing protein n=1 Tax=Actinomyces urogenitalis TaxID=103621 RepID=UPI002A81DEDF|nr:DUF5107 domain-containing protein [Actinomyces urogenitalis]MDY3679520.1 DUF5107 domain-containing protein [Actinomyces urogenitalis]
MSNDADNQQAFELPDLPSSLDGAGVAVWEAPVTIPTYEPGEADRYPQYLDQRVYQGSSGRVYPMPFIESVSSQPTARQWRAIHMKTDYVRLMILPELGGRIYHAEDLTKGYNFFYRNNVLKPALVGVLGPWISGGVELNWPQHHRPATYLPCDCTIEREADGAVTVWCSDLSPFERLKGMHGIRLRPGSSLIELRARLHNRTDDVQTFLWWANVAAPVGDHYQVFFPTDVHYVADHAKRAVTSFPHAKIPYYGVDYTRRVSADHPDADRIDWYRNIPVPTSYMCLGSEDDFFGGYDHQQEAGFVHVADHRIAPGKKLWTWGNHRFGWAWDRNLTNNDGPYVELMAGVFTDNQPDFTYLAPGETKTFSQYWYPIQDIGCATQANTDVAVRFVVEQPEGGQALLRVRVAASRRVERARVLVRHRGTGTVLHSASCVLAPGEPYLEDLALRDPVAEEELVLQVREGERVLMEWNPRPAVDPDSVTLPDPATESPCPQDIASVDELYLAGLHLYQYRHATRRPEDYWNEALRRDPGDCRVNVMMARLLLSRGQLTQALRHAQAAVDRLTWRNPNPYDSEAYYVLGRVMLAQGKDAAAYDAFAKATWSAAWKVASWEQMARIDLRRGCEETARDNLDAALRLDADNLEVRNLLAIACRRLGDQKTAAQVLREGLSVDPLDPWTRYAVDGIVLGGAQTGIDVALELASAGQDEDALAVLALAQQACAHLPNGENNPAPLIAYHRWDILERRGAHEEALQALEQARSCDRARAFPGRLEDALVLQRVISQGDGDPVASGLLGHWLYAMKRPADAIACWKQAPQDDPVILRNLAVGAVNYENDLPKAAELYDRARGLAPQDERLLYERDQLAARMGEEPVHRLDRLEISRDVVERRSDLSVILASLLLLVGRIDEAATVITSRQFQPWEGGEGMALAIWEAVHKALAQRALAQGDPQSALEAVNAALHPAESLGEDRHLLANCADLDLLLGDALAQAGNEDEARQAWQRAAEAGGDFVSMAPTAYSDKTAYSAQALVRLGREEEARDLFRALEAHALEMAERPATIDYFATSLPTMLLFHEDLQATARRRAAVMRAQARLGQADEEGARELLRGVLALDPAEMRAAELARALGGL